MGFVDSPQASNRRFGRVEHSPFAMTHVLNSREPEPHSTRRKNGFRMPDPSGDEDTKTCTLDVHSSVQNRDAASAPGPRGGSRNGFDRPAATLVGVQWAHFRRVRDGQTTCQIRRGKSTACRTVDLSAGFTSQKIHRLTGRKQPDPITHQSFWPPAIVTRG